MTISRRDWLKRTAAGTAGAALLGGASGCADAGRNFDDGRPLPGLEPLDAGAGSEAGLFTHGVASGDPLADRVILWSRARPSDGSDAEVVWEVADDAAFTRLRATGRLTASAASDHTLKVDATGLAPGKSYHYRFRSGASTSPIGRTRTIPAADEKVEHLRFGVASCSHYGLGHFFGYRRLAERTELDAILHLGDYQYEYGNEFFGGFRPVEPDGVCLTLEDYRLRHATTKSDPDLQNCHRQHPFITVWDDHEVVNDSSVEGSGNHDEDALGPYADRRAAALQAYHEWMPIRTGDDLAKIYRSFVFGDLLHLIMLDTRHAGRERTTRDREVYLAGARTLLGAEQEAYLADELEGTAARWTTLGQQVVISEWTLTEQGDPVNYDSWDGYPAARQRLYDAVEASPAQNFVVLTGDVHSSWARDIARDPTTEAGYDPVSREGAIGVEFVTPGVTSPGIPGIIGETYLDLTIQYNRQVHWGEPGLRGFMVFDVRRDRVQADWYLYPDGVREEVHEMPVHAASWGKYDGEPGVREMDAPLESGGGPDLAP